MTRLLTFLLGWAAGVATTLLAGYVRAASTRDQRRLLAEPDFDDDVDWLAEYRERRW